MQLISRGPQHRLLAVQAQGQGRLRILQWAHPHWRVRVRPDQPGAPWGPPVAKGGRDAQGWITVLGLDPVPAAASEAQRLGCSHHLSDGSPRAI